jgi:hypothetical protein
MDLLGPEVTAEKIHTLDHRSRFGDTAISAQSILSSIESALGPEKTIELY